MTVTGLPGAAAAVDPVAVLALAALDAQTEALLATSDRLARCRGNVPGSADDTWRGPARAAYEAGLANLRRLLAAAGASVDDALAETQRAAAAARQEVG